MSGSPKSDAPRDDAAQAIRFMALEAGSFIPIPAAAALLAVYLTPK